MIINIALIFVTLAFISKDWLVNASVLSDPLICSWPIKSYDHISFVVNIEDTVGENSLTRINRAYGYIVDADRFGNPNDALVLEGFLSALKISQEIILDEFTIGFWLQVKNASNDFRILTINGETEIVLQVMNGRFYYSYSLDNQGEQVFDSEDIDVSQWYHLTFLISQTEIHLFKNGLSVGSSSFKPNHAVYTVGGETNQLPSFIIGTNGVSDGYSSSVIDDIKLFSRILSNGEIAALYDPLVGSWSIDASDSPSSIGNTQQNFGGLDDGILSSWLVQALDTPSQPGYLRDVVGGNDLVGTWGNSAYLADDRFSNPNEAIALSGFLSSWFLSKPVSVSEFTVSFWINVKNAASDSRILTLNSENTIVLGIQNGRFYYSYFVNWQTGNVQVSEDIEEDEWYQLSFSVSQTDISLYVNGESKGLSNFTSNNVVYTLGLIQNGVASFIIGTNGPADGDLEILIDNIKLYEGVLSSKRVQSLFISTSSPSSEGNVNNKVSGNNLFSNARDNANLVEDRYGNPNAAMALNEFESSWFLTHPVTVSEFTFAFWVRVQNVSNDFRILTINGENSIIIQVKDGRFSYSYKIGVQNQLVLDSEEIDVDQWYHLAISVSHSKIIFYKNRAIVSSSSFEPSQLVYTLGGPINGLPSLILGTNGRSDGYSSGIVDDIKLYGRVLSDLEITNI